MPKRKHKSKPKEIQEIAKERIEELFRQAENAYKSDPKLSNRYVQLARKIAMKTKVKMTSKQRRMYCKHCYCFLMPGKNSRVRLTGRTITCTCFECKKHTRMGYKKK